MFPSVLAGHARARVCDYCHRLELSDGRWAACHPSRYPASHLIDEDICPECCAKYASFLLAPGPETDVCELAMPSFRHRS